MLCWPGPDGNRLCADAWGDPAAPPVVLLHGGGQTRHAWRHTARRLAEAGLHAVAYDARGHGDSDWVADGDYSEDAMLRDLACVIQAAGGRPPVLIGASIGGIAALLALGEGVVQASALVLADVVPSVVPAGSQRVRAFMAAHADGFASLDEAAQAIGRYQGAARASRNPGGLAKNLRRGADGRLYWHWDPRFLEHRDNLDARRQRLLASACRLAVPTLVVRGGGSDVVSDEGVREFQALNPLVQAADLADTGHMLTGDDNDAFGRMALAFIGCQYGG